MHRMLLIGAALAAVAVVGVAGYGVFTAVRSADRQQGSAMMSGGMMGGMMSQGMMAQPQSAPPDATGEQIFRGNCRLCHTIGANEGNGLGPNLHGLFGRRSGSLKGFPYSQAMRDAGIVWGEKTLDQYLAQPAGVVPGNRMPFAGIKDDGQRHALIAYLEEATK
ncbi:MAG: cytochrome c family protein [Alphaproteobacteria bacterium]|nr:cytochrome c family protein [Alphaproteobacteria bacterium]MDE2629608.1 cytochrome c family protein [Alphaproteobacteria bacterium]